MARIPKWLMLKEYLSFEDVTKLLDSAPSSVENVLAQDCSEDFGRVFRFVCAFSPHVCKQEFKEYRFESIARQGIRTHLKSHINDAKANYSEEEKKTFSTRNQLFKSSKNASSKHKLSLSNEIVPPKKPKTAVAVSNETEVVHQAAVKEAKKQRAQKFTKLKKIKKEKSEEKQIVVCEEQKRDENNHIKEEVIQENEDSMVENEAALSVYSPEDDESTSDDKTHDYCSEDADGGDKVSCETQTDHGEKEQETLQYKIATKLFAVDRSFWSNIDQILDDIVDAEKSTELLTQSDKDMILRGMKQWMDSVNIYDKHTMSRLHDPLTPPERSKLNALTVDDWKKLEKGQDNESKLRLTAYANMLLRDYESYPRKLKPKYCRHCEKLYTASTSLYSHLVSLAGIRHWVCIRCKEANKMDATFTRKHSLQYHILKEVGIPRYRCQQPGCSRTHNHTHHQKSHARQHTGEKNYVCSVDECRSRFSNRNTYSRHLLQFHHVELTRTNQLRAIDEKEATSKVNAARLKARERSKCKRQQGGDTSRSNESQDQAAADSVSKKRTIDENILNAAQHFLSEVKQEEGKLTTSEECPKYSLEKTMRHSASQLLSGIAKDVGSTTSLLLESKSPENLLGGLNLLATVSKYMNAESCIKTEPDVSEIEQYAAGDRCHDLKLIGGCDYVNVDMKGNSSGCESRGESSSLETQEEHDLDHYFPKLQVATVTNVKLLSFPVSPDNLPQHSKLMQVVQPPHFSQQKALYSSTVNSDSSFNTVLHSMNLQCNRNLLSSSISRLEPRAPSNAESISSVAVLKSEPTASAVTATYSSYSHSGSIANSLLYTQAGSIVVKQPLPLSSGVAVTDENEVCVKEEVIEESSFARQTMAASTHLLIVPKNALLPKLSSTEPSTSSRLDTANNRICTLTNSSAAAHTFEDVLDQPSLIAATQATAAKTPLSALSSNANVKCDPSLPGRIVADTHPCGHLTANNKLNVALAPTAANQTPPKSIQVIKVTNSPGQVQVRSLNCTTGRTYLILTTGGSPPASHSAEPSTASRILPFSEL